MRSSLRNMMLSLGILSAMSAMLLAFFYNITAEPRQKAAVEAAEAAVRTVLPPFDNDPLSNPIVHGDCIIYPAVMGDSLVGVAVKSVSHDGFSGDIVAVTGFNMRGEVINYVILSHAETPGLGAKAPEWFTDPERGVIGSRSELRLRSDGGHVDAITAATITSRAFVDAVNNARSAFNEYTSSL